MTALGPRQIKDTTACLKPKPKSFEGLCCFQRLGCVHTAAFPKLLGVTSQLRCVEVPMLRVARPETLWVPLTNTFAYLEG